MIQHDFMYCEERKSCEFTYDVAIVKTQPTFIYAKTVGKCGI